MHEQDSRPGSRAPGPDHLRRVEPGVDVGAVPGLERDHLRIDPLERPPFLDRRRGDLARRRSLLIRGEVHLRGLVAVGVQDAEHLIVGRHVADIRPRHGREFRPLPAVDRQRVEVPLARVALAGGEIEALPVSRERDGRNLEPAARQRARSCVGLRRVHDVQVHPAVLLRGEVELLLVRQEPGVAGAEASVEHPGVVANRVDDPHLAALRIDCDDPAILEVGCPAPCNRQPPVSREEGHAPVHFAVHFLAVAALGGRLHHLPLPGEPGIGPHGPARLQVEDGQAAPALDVAHVRPAGDHLAVRRLGDVVRRIRVLRPGRPLGHQEKHVLAVGRQRLVGHRLPLLDLEDRQRFLLALLLGLLPFLGRLAGELDELLLLGLEVPLTVGVPGVTAPRLHVGQLLEPTTLERHQEQVSVARKGDGLLVPSPAGIGLAAGGPRHLPPGADHRVEQDHVAPVGEQHPPAGGIPLRPGRRNQLALLVRQLARLAALPADGVGRGLLVARLAPLEVEFPGVARPAQARRRVADEPRASHDALDRQLKARSGCRPGDGGSRLSLGVPAGRVSGSEGDGGQHHGRDDQRCSVHGNLVRLRGGHPGGWRAASIQSRTSREPGPPGDRLLLRPG